MPREVQHVQNNNFAFAINQMKKNIQRSGKFSRIKELMFFITKMEKRKKKQIASRKRYMDLSQNKNN
jgi:ribosomal protein S21